MYLSDHIHAGGLVLTGKGREDFQARKTFQGAIENSKFLTSQRIIFNFFKVPLMDKAGLGLLKLAYKILEEAKSVSLAVSEWYVLHILALANIGKNIPITPTQSQPLPSGFPWLGTNPRNV